MPASLTPEEKHEVTSRLLEAFRRDGYDGSSLSQLSQATGLGRSSLYHHYPGGKEEMAIRVLDLTAAWVDTEIVAPSKGHGAPRQRFELILDALSSFYDAGGKPCILERLGASVDRAVFQTRLAAIFASLVDAIASLRTEAGEPPDLAHDRAEDALIRIQGSLVVGCGLSDPSPFRRTLLALRREFPNPPHSATREEAR